MAELLFVPFQSGGGGGGNANTFRLSFGDGDLDGNDDLTVNHGLAVSSVSVFVADNNDLQLVPDSVDVSNPNSTLIDFSSIRAALGGSLPGGPLSWEALIIG